MGKNSVLAKLFGSSIRARGIAAALVPVVLQLFFIFLLLNLHSRLREDQARTLHSKDVINRSLSIQRDMLKAHNYMRQYMMVEDAKVKEDFNENHQRVTSGLAELQRAVSDNPSQTTLLTRVHEAYINYNRLLSQVIQFVDEGKMDAVKEIIRSLRPAKTYDELDEEFLLFRANEEKLELARQVSLTDLSNLIFYLLIGSLGVVLAVCIFTIRLLDQSILSRIQHIVTNINLLAEGKPFMEPLEGNDEIVRLDAALHTLGRKLAERTAENEMFVYSVSHDLRSPLVNLQGFCEELSYSTNEIKNLTSAADFNAASKVRVKQLIEADLSEATYYIKNAVNRLSMIIDSLLKLSRAGRVTYQSVEVNLDKTVTRVIESLRESSSKMKVVITKDELPTVTGDPSALDQLFGNLIDNAIKYSDPKKGAEVHIGVDEEKSSDSSVVLFVKDNGLGIPTEFQPKLFMAFQRFHTEHARGEGIGLTMTKKIVERLSGTIWVESTENQGTTFFVQLPRKGSQELLFQIPRQPSVPYDADHI